MRSLLFLLLLLPFLLHQDTIKLETSWWAIVEMPKQNRSEQIQVRRQYTYVLLAWVDTQLAKMQRGCIGVRTYFRQQEGEYI